MTKEKYKIMIVAGEPSGDMHAAKLVRALREKAPEAEFDFFGATSHRLREAGVEQTVNADDFSIVGLPEIARALPMFWRAFRRLTRAAGEKKPDAAVLVDFPEFNLKLAKALKKRGIKVIYYISPQLWAWRRYRIRTIRRAVDLLLTILPFEREWYSSRRVEHVRYVGNPTVREVHAASTKEEFCRRHNLDAQRPIVALLAGSRHKEIVRILPVLLETAARMSAERGGLQFVVPLAASRKRSEVAAAVAAVRAKGVEAPANLAVVEGETYDALQAADAAAVTSGTATLETAIIGTPLAIVYKTSPINYKLLRPLISVPHFGLVNLIAEERVARELIQHELTPETLAGELFRLLEPEENRRMREKLKQAIERLGQGGASRRAAEEILSVLNQYG